MKKNLLSILILALVLTNLVLTIVLMFTILPVYQKTNNIVTKIAGILDIELREGMEESDTVSIDKIASYDIADKLTFNLKPGEDGKPHYLLGSVTISMNTEHPDYKTYGKEEELKSKESLIKSEINSIITGYTMEEIQADEQAFQDTLLEGIRKMYGSEFIIKVAFRDIVIQ